MVAAVLFHAGVESFSGGFVGVDVFFVISGYLITTIIITEMAEGRFSITHFFERRARRLLPALFLVMTVCLPFALFWLPAIDLYEFGESLISVSIFASNFFFWTSSGYFDIEAELKPLVHTWSLAVEEQYYILFPTFVLLTWRFGTKWILIFLVVVFLISFWIAVWGAQAFSDNDRVSGAFYLLPARGWELLVGGFIAFYLRHNPHLKSHGVNQFLSLLGLGLIIYSYTNFDRHTPFPSLYTLMPTVGAALIILSAVPSTIVNRLLSIKIFVGIGLVSYSAYLWHQPMLAFARYKGLGEPSSLFLLLLCCLSLVLAWLSWRFVERPFRNKLAISRKSIVIFSLTGIFSFSIIGWVVVSNDGFAAYKNKIVLDRLSSIGLSDYETNNKKLQRDSWAILHRITGADNYSQENNAVDRENNFDLSSNKKRVLVVGNSHSKDMFNVFYHSDEVSQVIDVARYGIQLHNIDTNFYTSDAYKLAHSIIFATQFGRSDLEILPELTSRVLEDNKQVFIVDPVYSFATRGTDTLADYTISRMLQVEAIPLDDLIKKVNLVHTNHYLRNQTTKLYQLTQKIYVGVKAQISVDHPQVVFLHRVDYICPNNRCHGLTPAGRKTYFDQNHQTAAGAAYFGERLHTTKFYRDLVAGLELGSGNSR